MQRFKYNICILLALNTLYFLPLDWGYSIYGGKYKLRETVMKKSYVHTLIKLQCIPVFVIQLL